MIIAFLSGLKVVACPEENGTIWKVSEKAKAIIGFVSLSGTAEEARQR